MSITLLDGIVFVLFIAFVIGVSLYASRNEKDSEDYFLAGRSLTWWLIGFSLIASNISTEHFVGMAGSGFGVEGLAIASYEWVAAVCLVVVALFLLPVFLKTGIYTMPEFLERRYGPTPRAIMAVLMVVAYVGVAIAAILYSGAIGLEAIFGLDLTLGIWLIGFLAGAYTVYGGLKAVVWSDLIQGVALLVGGTIVMILGFQKVGGVRAFLETNADKLHMVLPADHPEIPWTALLLGIFIPNFFYWGFNQFITQRTLGAKSLAEGQKGAVFGAAIKLFIPFIIVFPGIMAFQLYADQIVKADQAYPVLIANILPTGLRGLMFAALFGAVMSSLDSMLNSASTIFTMDIYRQHINRLADSRQLVKVGRIATVVLMILGCLMGPLPGQFEGVFKYIQLVWGFISPGVVVAFFFGLFFRRAPGNSATVVLIAGPILYGAFLWLLPDMAFLNVMALVTLILVGIMTVMTMTKPLDQPVVFEQATDIDLTPSSGAKWGGLVVVLLVVVLYVIFW